MPFPTFLIPLILAGAQAAGSAFSKKPEFNVPPEYQGAIDDLVARSKEGLSPGAEKAFLERGQGLLGSQLLGQRQGVSRNLARQGFAGGGMGNIYESGMRDFSKKGFADLSKELTLMDENAKGSALDSLVKALGSKTYAEGQKFYADKSVMPDFGTGIGDSLYAAYLMYSLGKGKKPGAGGGGAGQTSYGDPYPNLFG